MEKSKFISEQILHENAVALILLNLDIISNMVRTLIGMTKHSDTFRRFSATAYAPDLTSKIEEYESRLDVLQLKYDILKDEEGKEEEKEELRYEIIQLKQDVQSTLDDPADLGDLDDDSDIGYADEIDSDSEEPEESQYDDSETDYDEEEQSSEPDKPNYGDLVVEYEERAQEKWRAWFDRRCKGKTEGRENSRCRAQGVDYAIREVMSGISKCAGTNDPTGCRRSFGKLKQDWYDRKRSYFK